MPESQAVGSLRQGVLCLDTLGHLMDGNVGECHVPRKERTPLLRTNHYFFSGVYECHNTGGNQEWSITKKRQIKHHDLCLHLMKFLKGTVIIMRICDDSENQMWELTDGGLLKHMKSNFCVDTRHVHGHGVTAERCNSGINSQQWKFVNK